MKNLYFLFIKVPRKIFRALRNRLEYLYYRFICSKIKCSFDHEQKKYLLCEGDGLGQIAKNYKATFPEKIMDKITQADQICDHIFDLLGSGPTKLSKAGNGYQSIDWHSDFKAGYRWDPQTFYKRIKYGHVRGVDVKVPWELSRFQHLNTLGQAYILTGEQKYRDEFVNQVADWIDTNPVAFGVNWACTMDVAIRAANWLVAKELFDDSALPKEFLEKFYTSIYEHGRFIRNHLEYSSDLTTNHYVADLAGLYFIAVYCPFFKESASWQKFCVNELAREIQKQVYDDGCDFEASTSYHRLVLEMFFYCEFLGKRAGIGFPQTYKDKVRKMFEFSLYCVKPNGKIPQIGDNDNGRYLIFSSRPVLEHKYLLSLASIYYHDSGFKLPEFSFDEEAFWAFGAQGHAAFEQLPVRAKPLKSKAFPDAGWYIMRHNKDYCFISCGPNGQNGNGGHAHNDKLSFELMLDGEDIIVDPGTYCYTPYPEWRVKFRSTAFHNTVQIDGMEQNDILGMLFSMRSLSICGIVKFEENDTEIIFNGELNYTRDGISHNRIIRYNRQSSALTVRDNIRITGEHQFKLMFCLKKFPMRSQIKIQQGTLVDNQGFYSEGYGSQEQITCLNIEKVSQAAFDNTVIIGVKD